MEQTLLSPSVVSSVVDGVFNLLCVITPSLVAYQWVRNQRYVRLLRDALNEIKFTRAVIAEYGNDYFLYSGTTKKRTMFKRARQFTELDANPAFTPVKIERLLDSLPNQHSQSDE